MGPFQNDVEGREINQRDLKLRKGIAKLQPTPQHTAGASDRDEGRSA